LVPEVGLTEVVFSPVMGSRDGGLGIDASQLRESKKESKRESARESAGEPAREPDPLEANTSTQRAKSQTLTGEKWRSLSAAMQSDSPLTNTLRFCAELDALSRQALQSQLRQIIHFHCGMGTLKTRQFMMDIQVL
jgi:hypothetical protein